MRGLPPTLKSKVHGGSWFLAAGFPWQAAKPNCHPPSFTFRLAASRVSFWQFVMAQYENFQSNAAEFLLMRKWLLRALVISLLIHAGLMPTLKNRASVGPCPSAESSKTPQIVSRIESCPTGGPGTNASTIG